MSGGSFDYAYQDTWDFSKAESLLRKIYDMRGRILTTFPNAVPHLNEMAQSIEKARDEYLERASKLEALLKSIEWYYSGDWGEDSVEKAINDLKPNEGPSIPFELKIREGMDNPEAIEALMLKTLRDHGYDAK